MARILFVREDGSEKLLFEGTQEEVAAKVQEYEYLRGRISDFRTVPSDEYPIRYEVKTFFNDEEIGAYRNYTFYIDLERSIDTRRTDI